MDAVGADQARTEQAESAQALDRTHSEALPAIIDFLFRFMQMQVDRQVALLGEREHPAEGAVADCIRCVRRQAKAEQRFAAQLVAGG